MKKTILIFLLALGLVTVQSCVPSVRFTENSKRSESGSNAKSGTSKSPKYSNNSDNNNDEDTSIPVGQKFRGAASYYGDEFEGRKTSSGQVFTQDGFTAAHKELPFGTKLMVMNLRNGRTVNVIINDRGPFVAGRVVDLSKSAAQQLDMIRDGVVEVECTIINN